jgi:hypothetical protein
MARNRAQLLTFFRLEDESLSAFAAELRKLSDEEKDELAREVAQHLGETWEPSTTEPPQQRDRQVA